MQKPLALLLAILIFMNGLAWGETAEEWYLKGYEADAVNNHDEAINCYEHAVSIEPDYTDAHYNLGLVYGEKGMLDEAIAAYEKVISLYGGHLDSHNNLGTAYMKKGMLDKSIVAYKQTLVIDPGHVKTYSQLGVVYGKQGSYGKSVKHFYRAGVLGLKHFYNSVVPFFKFAVWRLRKNIEKLKSRWMNT